MGGFTVSQPARLSVPRPMIRVGGSAGRARGAMASPPPRRDPPFTGRLVVQAGVGWALEQAVAKPGEDDRAPADATSPQWQRSTVEYLSEERRQELAVGADELHHVPLQIDGSWESQWALALWRFRPTASENAVGRNSPPVMLVPGCASNSRCYDLAPSVSLARYLAANGFEVWSVEPRGVGSSRRSGREAGSWDFDSYVHQDLPTLARHIAGVTGQSEILGVGHSMGGMGLAAMVGLQEQRQRDAGGRGGDACVGSGGKGVPVIAGAALLGSCLECSGAAGHSSSYAEVAEWYAGVKRSLGAWAGLGARISLPHVPIRGVSIAEASIVDGLRGRRKSLADSLVASTSRSLPPPLMRRLLQTGFDDVPPELLGQLATVFQPGGLTSRDGAVRYLDLVRQSQIPLLAVAGDADPMFCPSAVRGTAEAARGRFVCVGGPSAGEGRESYSHFDVVCGANAPEAVFPRVLEHLAECCR